MLSMNVVLANASIVRVANDNNPALFRSLLSGGGGNFGIITQFSIQLHRAATAVNRVCATGADLGDTLAVYSNWLRNVASDDIGAPAIVYVDAATATLQMCVDVFGVASDFASAVDAAVNGTNSLAQMLVDAALNIGIEINRSNASFYDFELHDAGSTQLNNNFGFMSSFVVTGDISMQFSRAIVGAIAAAPSSRYTLLNIHDMGGNMRRHSRFAKTSYFPHRDSDFVMQLKVLWPHSSSLFDKYTLSH